MMKPDLLIIIFVHIIIINFIIELMYAIIENLSKLKLINK